jgi:hypothetical protein
MQGVVRVDIRTMLAPFLSAAPYWSLSRFQGMSIPRASIQMVKC